MPLPTVEEMINQYLYGKTTKPVSMTDDGIIRPEKSGPTEISVDINEYMDGPGRFANPALFESIRAFFNPAFYIPVGEWSEKQLSGFLGGRERIIKQQQWEFNDETNDYAERVFIWNTVAFEIRDDDGNEQKTNPVRFVVERKPDGSLERYIKNFAIVPFTNTGCVIHRHPFTIMGVYGSTNSSQT